MYLRYGLLADAVVHGAIGKKNIIGTFSAIQASEFPCIHSSLSIAMRIEGDSSEVGTHSFELGFVDADYRAVVPPLKGRFKLETGKMSIEGISVAVEMEIEVNNLPLPKEGAYEFIVQVNGRHLGSIPLYVVSSPAL